MVGSNLIMGLAMFGLVVFSVLGIVWGLFYPKLSKNRGRDERIQTIRMSKAHVIDKNVSKAVADRRKGIEENLKQIEEDRAKGKKKRASLGARLNQAGLEITPKQFYLYSLVSAFVCFLLGLFGGVNFYVCLGFAAVGFFGLPSFYLSRRRKKRIKKFTAEFPNAVDVIVRGIKTGLPLGDCIAIAASETAEPVRSEFQRLVDEQAMGLPLSAVVPHMHDRVPIPETNFFAIVIAIQTQAGGSLSEALGNLSRVLRSRAQMKDKISAMSMEAKASAAIIGAMPFIIAFMTYLSSPDYIMVMFQDFRGLVLLAGTLAWMSIGVVMMRAMINFDV